MRLLAPKRCNLGGGRDQCALPLTVAREPLDGQPRKAKNIDFEQRIAGGARHTAQYIVRQQEFVGILILHESVAESKQLVNRALIDPVRRLNDHRFVQFAAQADDRADFGKDEIEIAHDRCDRCLTAAGRDENPSAFASPNIDEAAVRGYRQALADHRPAGAKAFGQIIQSSKGPARFKRGGGDFSLDGIGNGRGALHRGDASSTRSAYGLRSSPAGTSLIASHLK